MPASLVYTDERGQKWVYDLAAYNKPQLTIGRGEDNDIRISSAYASRQHGVIDVMDGRCSYIGFKKTNGVFYNGAVCGNKGAVMLPLSEGDVLAFGNTALPAGSPGQVSLRLTYGPVGHARLLPGQQAAQASPGQQAVWPQPAQQLAQFPPAAPATQATPYPQTPQPSAQGSSAGKAAPAMPAAYSPAHYQAADATNASVAWMPAAAEPQISAEEENGGWLSRYVDPLASVFMSISGIIVSLLGIIASQGTWLMLKPLFGIGSGYSFRLDEASDLASTLSSIARIFDPSLASSLNTMATVANISYFILIFGGIVIFAASVAVLCSPKLELLVLVEYIGVIAFAVVGLVFTAAPMLFGDVMSYSAWPIVILVVAGIPVIFAKLFL